jgi:xanthine dehydrogenase YagT iron-sulfur-binding subunit
VLGGTVSGLALHPMLGRADDTTPVGVASSAPSQENRIEVALRINGNSVPLSVDPRTSLLDALREQAGLTGTKKGCDRGACGACTVHIDGRRMLSCLTLAARCQGKAITTIEGLGAGEDLHPVQAAFLHHDGFQCGYCTPGQIMSAAALIREGHTGSDAEIREWMSGNICRCGAYPNIVAAIRDAAQEG